MTNIATTVYSILGNNSSLIPLGIKDVSNSLGMTAGSYVTGSNAEGKDRFIDEFGTLVIWLMGVPFFKKVIDKTVYKIAGYNPSIDTRISENKDVFAKAKEQAAKISPELAKDFEKVEKNPKIFKGLFLGKFFTATALTLGAYSLLTTTRHKHTEKTVMEEIKKEQETKKANQAFMAQKNVSKAFKPHFNGLNPTSLMGTLKQFMFDPVKNTMIIDGGITTERLVDSRSPQDFMGYVIKEGGFWAFMYFAGEAIQKHFENSAAKSGKHIDLDIRVLQDPKFEQALKDGTIEKHLKDFSTEGTDAQVYESLFNKPENLIVQMAKKADIIGTINSDDMITRALKSLGIKKSVKETEQIDPTFYIDMAKIKGTSDQPGIKGKIQKLYDECKTLSPEQKETFFKDVLNLKRMSVVKNIGACIGVLGIVIPGIMVASRMLGKDNKEFQVKKDLREKMGVEA